MTRRASLGAPVARVCTPHLVEDRTDDEVRASADATLEQIVQALTAAD